MKRAILLLLVFLASTAYAEIYYWTDDNGVKHFSNTPVGNTPVLSDGPQVEQRTEVESNAYGNTARRFNDAIPRQTVYNPGVKNEFGSSKNSASDYSGNDESALMPSGQKGTKPLSYADKLHIDKEHEFLSRDSSYYREITGQAPRKKYRSDPRTAKEWGLGMVLLSFFLTWGIGLAPPLLIRFVFLRRSIVKAWAIGGAALFLVLNIVIFEILGSQSKTHAALILVAIVSYLILRTDDAPAWFPEFFKKAGVEPINSAAPSFTEQMPSPSDFTEPLTITPSESAVSTLITENESRDIAGPSGVGGWLLFFCVGVTILSPFFSIGKMALVWEQGSAVFRYYPAFESALYFESIAIALVLLYGFVVGLMIWGGNRAGRRLAKQYLLIRLLGIICIEIITLVLMSNLPSQLVWAAVDGIIKVIIVEGVYFLIWWLYFKKSIRVRNTYASE